MALILILIITGILFLINRKKFIVKPVLQQILWLGIYFIGSLVGLFLLFEIIHIIKYHSIN